MLPQTGNIGDKTVYHCRKTSQKCATNVKIAIKSRRMALDQYSDYLNNF